jgi:hypothetical protein
MISRGKPNSLDRSATLPITNLAVLKYLLDWRMDRLQRKIPAPEFVVYLTTPFL